MVNNARSRPASLAISKRFMDTVDGISLVLANEKTQEKQIIKKAASMETREIKALNSPVVDMQLLKGLGASAIKVEVAKKR